MQSAFEGGRKLIVRRCRAITERDLAAVDRPAKCRQQLGAIAGAVELGDDGAVERRQVDAIVPQVRDPSPSCRVKLRQAARGWTSGRYRCALGGSHVEL